MAFECLRPTIAEALECIDCTILETICNDEATESVVIPGAICIVILRQGTLSSITGLHICPKLNCRKKSLSCINM